MPDPQEPATPVPAAATGAGRSFRLVAKVLDGFDAGRDICRLHPETMQALGARIWDPVVLEGDAAAAGLCGHSDWNSPRDVCTIDALTAENAGLATGSQVIVTPVAPVPASAIWLDPVGEVADAQIPADALRAALLGKAVITGERESLLPQDFNRPFSHDSGSSLALIRKTLGPQWQHARVRVRNTEPDGAVVVAARTAIHWGGEDLATSGGDTDVTIADLAGLDTQIAELREVIELPLLHRDLLSQLGVDGPGGVLIEGPPGSGKRALTYAVANSVGATVSYLSGIDLEYVPAQKTAERISSTFADAGSAGIEPGCIILIEDIERIAPADTEERGGGGTALLRALDAAHANPKLIVVATSPDATACDPAVFESGRLDRRIETPLPSRKARAEILAVESRSLPLATDVDLDQIAARTPGFVGSDLARLCGQAAMEAAARIRSAPEPAGEPRAAEVTAADFETALGQVAPSSLGAARVQTADVSWADVGNAEATKAALAECVLWPIRYPDTFARLALAPTRGVLLYGPPGCGKTFVVAALANEAEANMISVKGAELMSKWVGDSEAGVRDVFRRARAATPAVVFLDEIDALAPRRGGSTDSGVSDRVVAQLLTELDGFEPLHGVAVVAATNRPDLIDPALLRPGRLERHVFVEPPNADARVAIFRAVTAKMPVESGIDLDSFARSADGFSAADLAAVARAAGYEALRRDAAAATIGLGDLETAFGQIVPSVDAATVARLREFAGGH